ncbi:hypothetical protein EMIT0111MI5_110140 [Burkholderia sp. IT-111MI5]
MRRSRILGMLGFRFVERLVREQPGVGAYGRLTARAWRYTAGQKPGRLAMATAVAPLRGRSFVPHPQEPVTRPDRAWARPVPTIPIPVSWRKR